MGIFLVSLLSLLVALQRRAGVLYSEYRSLQSETSNYGASFEADAV